MNAFDIIKTVRVTEKGTRQGEKLNQYTVVANPRANKPQIRQAVQELFKVKVLRVNTLNVRGKMRRVHSVRSAFQSLLRTLSGQLVGRTENEIELALDDAIRTVLLELSQQIELPEPPLLETAS